MTTFLLCILGLVCTTVYGTCKLELIEESYKGLPDTGVVLFANAFLLFTCFVLVISR
jgi:hypothetical protein